MKFLSTLFALCLFILVAIPYTLNPPRAFAQEQFSSNYDVTYDIDENGVTTVTEKISFKNLTDKYYASSFSLLIDATNITEVAASDSVGPLDTKTSKEGSKTKIEVPFDSQIAGKDKIYNWVLSFKSADFAQKQGSIWQVSIPRISSASTIDTYQLTLLVPDSFGNPGTVLPEPVQQADINGKLKLIFTKDQLKDTGILANFGTNQLLHFTLTYHLQNTGILPSVAQVALPPDTDYQQVRIDSITPKPENVTIDQDGNYIAWFKVPRLSSQEVKVEGLTKLYINSLSKLPFLLSKQQEVDYTSSNQYWEKENPIIQAKLADIFKNGQPASVRLKAQAINSFVVNTLKFDDDKLQNNDLTRLGGLTALNNPDNALAAEFSDLFITLARADGIPARELIGYAYSSNHDLRPVSPLNSLHVWPEYYDPSVGWVMIDPTWQNTTGGVDYFSEFDLSHFAFAIRGSSSTGPVTPDISEVSFSQEEFTTKPNTQIMLQGPSQFLAGFPASMRVIITNNGGVLAPSAILTLKTNQINIPGSKSFSTPQIAPFGHLEYQFDLRSRSLLSSFDDSVVLTVGSQTVTQKIQVRPFFTFKLFPLMVVMTVAAIVAIYVGVLTLHLYQHRAHYFQKKKKKH